MIWNREAECLPASEMEKLQLERLKTTVRRVYHNVPYYHKAFDKAGIKPEEVKSLDDLKKFPFTTKS